MKKRVDWFAGEEVLQEDFGHEQDARQQNERGLYTDLWTQGIIKDPNGLSNLAVTVDGTTTSLINIGWGTGYANGYRVAIEDNSTYLSTNPTSTTNGVCTPQSSGNRGVPLASYAAGQSNFVWLQYLEVARTNPLAVSVVDGAKHYPYRDGGYKVVVSTTNPPGNTNGITNSIYLATVFGQGASVALQGAPNGICNASTSYAAVLAKDSVSKQNLQDGVFTPQKVSQTDGAFTFPGLCSTTLVASSNMTVPIQPLLPTSAASRKFAQYAGMGIAVSKTVFRPTYDGFFNIINITIEGDSSGLITPVYDGLCNITRMTEAIDGRNVTHEFTWTSPNGVSQVTTISENGV